MHVACFVHMRCVCCMLFTCFCFVVGRHGTAVDACAAGLPCSCVEFDIVDDWLTFRPVQGNDFWSVRSRRAHTHSLCLPISPPLPPQAGAVFLGWQRTWHSYVNTEHLCAMASRPVVMLGNRRVELWEIGRVAFNDVPVDVDKAVMAKVRTTTRMVCKCDAQPPPPALCECRNTHAAAPGMFCADCCSGSHSWSW